MKSRNPGLSAQGEVRQRLNGSPVMALRQGPIGTHKGIALPLTIVPPHLSLVELLPSSPGPNGRPCLTGGIPRADNRHDVRLVPHAGDERVRGGPGGAADQPLDQLRGRSDLNIQGQEGEYSGASR